MVRGNTVVLNASGGELSPAMYSRIDLPAYGRGFQRVQNYIVQAQGGLLFRNGSQHVKGTFGLGGGILKTFAFDENDTYVMEFTNQMIRFYRNFEAVLSPTSVNISGINAATSCVVTTATPHGLPFFGQEVYLSGLVGMPELNDQFFIATVLTTTSFSIANLYGGNINSTGFLPYISGGTVQTPYQIASPYLTADLPNLQMDQSADEIYIVNQSYAPYKLQRTLSSGNPVFSIGYFTRTGGDPFGQQLITSITLANPAVFTTPAAHGFTVGQTVYLDGYIYIANAGSGTYNNGWWQINTVPSSTTFTLTSVFNGGVLDLLGVPIPYVTGTCIVIAVSLCPKTVAFLNSTRCGYGNWTANPPALAFSESPNATTGATQFDNFTPGASATNACFFTLSPVFKKIEAAQWMSMVNGLIVIGGMSSCLKLTGGSDTTPISPSAIQASPISNVGAAAIAPFTNGQAAYYVDETGTRIRSITYNFQFGTYIQANQNLTSRQICSSPFVAVEQQTGDAAILWVTREDGVLAGMTFNELESIYGWHRHYIGGNSVVNGANFQRAKVLSAAVQPLTGAESVLWLMVERQTAAGTYRSVEYFNTPVTFAEEFEFISGNGQDAETVDKQSYLDATYEQLKQSVHVDAAITYDGSQLSSTVTMTPSVSVVGATGTMTASAAFFTSSMVGQQIWNAYDVQGQGGGRAQITAFVSSTVVDIQILSAFDNTSVIEPGDWYLTAATFYGLLHLVGETLTVQADGAPAGNFVVQPDGSITLPDQSSVVHAGYGYTGLAVTMNLMVPSQRGPSEAKIRKMLNMSGRFQDTVGGKLGTTLWNARDLSFRDADMPGDRPVGLFSGVQHQRPEGGWTRQNMRGVLKQDEPSPQYCLGLDFEMEVSDD